MVKKSSSKDINNIWMLTREYGSIAGAGGVKDVSCQLAEALVRLNKSVTVILPCYGFIDPQGLGFTKQAVSFAVDMNYTAEDRREEVSLWKNTLHGVTLYLVDAERYREKQSIYTYTAEDEAKNPYQLKGSGHFDYFAMNVLLQKAALDLLIILGQTPDIIHCQDGHTAILPAMLREGTGYRHYFSATAAVVTIHNAGQGYHQEVRDLPFARAICGLPYTLIHNNLLDGSFDPFLAASNFAALNTVSENYARELRETDDDALTGWLGHRLMTRGIRLEGITNGFNPEDFDTTQPEQLGLPAAYDPAAGDLAGKKICRHNLLQSFPRLSTKHLSRYGSLADDPGKPLFTLIGRLTPQKGVDILLPALEALLQSDNEAQVLILGSGTKEFEQALAGLAQKKENAGRICLLIGYDSLLANRIYAAGDFFLIPSRYEPCGLTDYIAQLAGNLPIVHHVGGLVKVEDGVTGFAFKEYSSDALLAAMLQAITVFRKAPGKIPAMQKAAVKELRAKYTWDKVVHRYLKLYEKAGNLPR
ncbi:MAG: glycosyl transferase family 1 [Desulfobacterales bacterium SG8_35]|nr:MAG: glycosyl transferase family 1 [Desulfobacterales bacterium SG8_35]